jgi:hypothetical protein
MAQQSFSNVHATGPPLITNKPVPSRVSSPAAIRSAFSNENWAMSLAKDMESLSRNVDSLHSALTQNQSVNSILVTNNQGQVVAAIGNVVNGGEYFTNWFSEIHVGDPLLTKDPRNALFNANLDGSVTIGQHGWLDVLDPYSGIAAYLGTQFDSITITDAADNGSGLIRLTLGAATDLVTGNTAQVRGMQNAGVPNATGTWTVTVVDSTHVDLQGSVFAGMYVAPTVPFGIDTVSPTIDRVLQISGITSHSGLFEVQTAVAHTYETGDRVNISGVTGMPTVNTQWTVTVIDSTHFTLDNSTFAGSFTTGGTSLRYFAGGLFQTIAVGPSFQDYLLRAFADGSLRIRDAQISLTSPFGTIVIDPEGAPDGAATIVITNNSGAHITITSGISSTNPSIIGYDSGGIVRFQLGMRPITNAGFLDLF